jgi:hypothetical protein
MAFTSDDLASLDAVIASGESSWRYGDRGATYQGTSELLKIRQIMLDDIAASTKVRRPRITRVSQSGSGY